MTATRTWTRTDFGRAIRWTSDDGRALVCVVPVAGGYQCRVFEDGQYVGSEPAGPYRSCEVLTAKRWIRALSKPVE